MACWLDGMEWEADVPWLEGMQWTAAAAWLAEEEERSTGRQFRIVVAGVTYQVQVQEG